MRVINFFAGPGSGKSTTAAGLFYHMKSQGINCELVGEYAKDMVWEGRDNILSDQLYLLAKQNRRLSRLNGKVDYVITDSPILMQQVYSNDKELNNLNTKIWNSYNNINVFLDRDDRVYQQEGRVQNYSEAQQKDVEIISLLRKHREPFLIVKTKDFDFEKFMRDE